MSAPHPRPRLAVRWPIALAIDAALVLVFATIGRASHERGLSVPGVLETAWPFLVALAVGWLVVRAWRAPTAVLRTGLPIVVVTVAGGMLLRLATGAGAATAFIVVASITLLVLFVGWRLIARVATR
jgi:hypothetical protein